MSGPRLLDQGIVYRNQRPHVCSRHAYFPSLAVVGGGEVLCSVVLGEAFEAVDLHAYLARSRDGGVTWALDGELLPRPPGALWSDACRLTALSGERVVALLMRYDRSAHPEEGLTNPTTLGFVPTEMVLLDSGDRGRTWQPPHRIQPPLEGPAFELCAPVTPLRDGTWLLPTSTWRGWDGRCPHGMKMVALRSRDGGRSWPEYADVMADPAQRHIYWESKIVELADGRLLATAWVYDQQEARDLPNHFALSADGGRTWTRPRSTGLHGQTLTPLALPDGRVLCVYRRLDEPGLWAVTATLAGDSWTSGAATALWGHGAGGLTAHSANMSANFAVLRFGAPCLALLPDGAILGAFWCYEDCVSGVRWFRLRVD